MSVLKAAASARRRNGRHAGLLAAALCLSAPAAGLAADRAALVIGNQEYENAPAAVGAKSDARHMAEALRAAGYEVFEGYDLDSKEMRELLAKFEQAARAGADKNGEAEGLAIYVSAQAVRANGRGYVAPTDLDPATLTAVTLDGAPVDLLVDLASLAPGRSVVMLDLSRPRGFKPTGIAEPGFADLDEPEDVLVVASAPPGQATRGRGGSTSAFALHSAEEMLKPGALANGAALALAGLMRRSEKDWPETWITGGADDGFALVEAPATPVGELRAQMELAAWKAAEDSGARRDYQQYLRYFPDGVFADTARDRIAAIDAKDSAATDARRAEEALRLTVRERSRVQSRLTALGFDTAGVDGVFGPASRRAIAGWQSQRGDQATGYLTETQLAALRDDSDDRRRAAEEDRQDWDRAHGDDTAAAYEAYLSAHPDGAYTANARDRLAALRAAPPAAQTPESAEAALGLSRADRIDLQRALTGLGYDTGGADGAFGPASRRAISLWQRDRGETPTGYLTEAQVAALSQPSQTRPPVYDSDEEDWRRAAARDDEAAYRDYLRQYPNGRHASEAERRIADLRYRAEDVAVARDEERRQNLSEAQRRSIEGRLATLGYDPGSQDGRFTDRTRAAIASFQRAQGILESGYADRATVRALVDLTPQVTQQELIGGAIGEIFRQFGN